MQRETFTSVAGVRVPVHFVGGDHPALDGAFGAAVYTPKDTAIYLHAGMTNENVQKTLHHERHEMLLLMLGLREEPVDYTEVIIRCGELLL